MGESACLMQTFSHVSDTPHEAKEGNPIHALGESISFGRFMSESLAWEKWSSFNNNRYLEEVEKYSKPGSVAQKKAYFEAHYKRIAEKKAAALLDQANAEVNNVLEAEADDVHSSGAPDSDLDGSHCHVAINELGKDEVSNTETSFSTDANGCNSNGETGGLEAIMVEEVDQVIKHQVLMENTGQFESLKQHEDVEKINEVTKKESTLTKSIEKSPLKESFAANQEALASTAKTKPGISSSKSSAYCGASKLPSTPARPQTPIHPRKENNPSPSSKKTVKDLDKTRSVSKLPFSPARPRTPVHPRKENNPSPNNKKTGRDLVDKTRSAPKSLHMSINFTPSKSCTSETNKISSPIIQKIRDSRISANSTKTSKGCSTPLRTPSRASVNGVPKLPPVTPQSESRRTGTQHVHTVHGSRKVDLKWQSLSVDHSKSSRGCGNKAWSPSVSSSFIFRSEERAAKRKEYFQKLEEKFNTKEAQKMQLHTNSKDKVETELKKLRQSLGFKAKPMPDFYRQSESPKNQIKKIPLTRPRSPKLGRKPNPSTIQDTSPLPPRRPSVKSDGSKHGTQKTSRTPTHSGVPPLPKKNTRENASPNIQS